MMIRKTRDKSKSFYGAHIYIHIQYITHNVGIQRMYNIIIFCRGWENFSIMLCVFLCPHAYDSRCMYIWTTPYTYKSFCARMRTLTYCRAIRQVTIIIILFCSRFLFVERENYRRNEITLLCLNNSSSINYLWTIKNTLLTVRVGLHATVLNHWRTKLIRSYFKRTLSHKLRCTTRCYKNTVKYTLTNAYIQAFNSTMLIFL